MFNRTITIIVMLIGISCGSLLAQDSSSGAFAFRGGAKSLCPSFLILETGVLMQVDRAGGYTDSPGFILPCDFGYMVNTSDRWAFGGSFHAALGEDGFKFGVRGRARRWLTPRIGLDLSPGLTFAETYDAASLKGLGLVLGTSVTFGDYVSIDAYYESYSLRIHGYTELGAPEVRNQHRRALYLGATGRSYFAPVVAGGLAAVALLIAAIGI